MPIRVRSKRPEGFWRCGVRHPAQWVEHPDGRFTAAQLDALKAEPMLEVEVEIEEPRGEAKPKAKGK